MAMDTTRPDRSGRAGHRLLGTLLVPVTIAIVLAVALAFAARTGASGAGASAGGDGTQPVAATAPVRIMPLGDSITGSPGCWRALLWNDLQSAGYTNIDFVGTQPPQGCGVPYDGDSEGHGGALATNIVSQNELPGWLAATNPNIVLMHLGTNDVWSSLSTQTILTAYSTLIQQMRANNPSMIVLVAQIIPMNPSGCSTCAQGVVNLDAAIPAWAASVSTAQSPVIAVDQWTGFDDATDTVDGVHPDDSGNQKMAARWYPALIKYLTPNSSSSSTPTASASASASASATSSASPSVSASASASASASPSRSASSSASASASPSSSVSPSASSSGTSGGARCAAAYSITNQWQGGFQAAVTVTAGSAAISGWTVSFAFANGQTVTQSWSTALSQSGAAVTATNLSWNGSLAAGSSTAFGFLGSLTGSPNTVPVVTCVAH